MSSPAEPPAPSPWSSALQAMAIFAVDPAGCGGVALRAQAGPVRERWLALLRAVLPEAVPWRKMPVGIGDGRLLGGLDLGATLQAGRPVAERGLLAEADGGVVVVAMAERLSAGMAARLAAVLDRGEACCERDGVALLAEARIGLVALDEAAADEECLCAPLRDRLAFQIALEAIGWRDAQGGGEGGGVDADQVAIARALLEGVSVTPSMLDALCEAAAALGIASIRAPILAARVARAAAALAGRDEAGEEDAAWAARLVLGPRATRLPESAPQDSTPDQAPPPPPEQDGRDQPDQAGDGDGDGDGEAPEDDRQELDSQPRDSQPLGEVILEAARAAVPAGLLKQLEMSGAASRPGAQQGRQGAAQKGGARGRPIGTQAGLPDRGRRLDLIETLRAAAPWQGIRAEERVSGHRGVMLRREDLRIRRCEQRTRTVTIFVVDASGSSALNRLAEAKGAVELLLADCYQRRDQVAVLAFRGRAAQLLLPPTRSLVRAKRSLATLPGGGGTPLAAGIEAGFLLASAVRRGGFTPTLVLLTDGRANVTRAGTGGRAQAAQDAMAAARLVRGQRLTALLVDTSPRPAQEAADLAREMGARYLPLPYADAASLSRSVRAAQSP